MPREQTSRNGSSGNSIRPCPALPGWIPPDQFRRQRGARPRDARPKLGSTIRTGSLHPLDIQETVMACAQSPRCSVYSPWARPDRRSCSAGMRTRWRSPSGFCASSTRSPPLADHRFKAADPAYGIVRASICRRPRPRISQTGSRVSRIGRDPARRHVHAPPGIFLRGTTDQLARAEALLR